MRNFPYLHTKDQKEALKKWSHMCRHDLRGRALASSGTLQALMKMCANQMQSGCTEGFLRDVSVPQEECWWRRGKEGRKKKSHLYIMHFKIRETN